jgi:Tol biopolymer transport system component/DNA-binding winged helix-turn-helix (wHTH) protein/predicted Ser/Thr protein kinase
MRGNATGTLRFGPFVIERGSRELRKGGTRIRLPKQSVEILLALLERPGHVVSRDEVIGRLWPHGTVVEYEHSIHAAVRRAREALGDTAAKPKFIETVAGVGYRYIGPAIDFGQAAEATETPGRTLGYRLQGEAGRGAMGVVYRAEDLRLGRTVALKFVPEELFDDPAVLQRFRREARVLASLNHPGICTLYDIDEYEGRPCLVMEFLEGRSLRQFLESGSGLPMNRILEISIQTADALAAAHAAGIIHRDIKPENIFVTQRGRIKLLDFGVAKRSERAGGQNPEDSISATESGQMLGTIEYMSPEQVRGEELDCRTDLFSFGAVLYEMATGRKAFAGSTPGVIQEAILNRAVEPRRDLSPALRSIIGKALQKDRGVRYQCASAIRDDLEHFTQRPQSARLPPGSALVWHALFGRRAKWFSMAGVAAVAIASAVLWLALRGGPIVEPPRPVPLTTLPGAEWSPTFSPDGSQVAFAWNGEKQDNVDIYVTVIGVNGGLPLRLTFDAAPDVDPAWSPDGRWIAFRRIASGEHQILLVNPLGTGVEQKISTLPCPGGHCSGSVWANRLSWSSDSRFLAVSDVFSPHSKGQIFLLEVSTHEKRRLNLPSGGEFVRSSNPIFSPDGRKLAFVAGETGSEHIYVQKLDSSLRLLGQPMQLVQAGGYPEIDWTEDSHSLIYSWGYLWRISADGGRPERLPGPGTNTFALARRGKRLAYEAGSPLGSVVANMHRVSRQFGGTTPLVSSSYPSSSAQYSDDGRRVVFTSARSGTMEIWTCSSNGAHCSQITSLNSFAGSPRFSPDGQYVAFDSPKYGSGDIFVVNSGGGTARRLTVEESNDSRPSWSRDGKWIYFGSDRSGEFQIWKVPVGGGTARQVTRNGGYEPVESLDGKALYYIKRGEEGIWIAPAAGGDEKLVVNQGEEGRWALGARGVYLFSRIQSAVDYYDLATQTISRVRTLPALNMIAMLGAGPEFAVSPDEQWFLYFAVEQNESDLMLQENFP